MSKMRLISVFAMSLVMLAAACCFVTGAFPLAAAPQMITDGMGVTVETNGASLIHRGAVFYPQSALRDHVEGIVMVQVKIGPAGEVTDANVMSGPDALRKGVLTSVLDWHFTRDMANSTRQVTVAFQLPKGEAAPQATTVMPVPGTVQGVITGVPGGVRGGVNGGVVGGVIATQPSDKAQQDARDAALAAQLRVRQPAIPGTLKSIDTSGLTDQVRTELLARLPFREGDTITMENFRAAAQAVRDYDEHMGLGVSSDGNGQTTLHITTPHSVIGQFSSNGMMAVTSTPAPPGSIRVGGNVQQAKLTSQVTPQYPALAKQARIQGVVHLNALIAKDGTVKELSVISGHPLLVQAAMDAVRQWTYAQTLLNGSPVDVFTQIDVNFTLSQ